MRKHVVWSVLLLGPLLPTFADASVPVTLAVQGRLTSLAGGPVVDGDYALTFSLYLTKTAKAAAWKMASDHPAESARSKRVQRYHQR